MKLVVGALRSVGAKRLGHHAVAAARRGGWPRLSFSFAGEFERRRQQGEFLECAEVFGGGDWYGTLVDEVAPRLAAGKWVVLEIDVEGTRAIVQQYPDAVTIFVRPESLEELERRLRSRGTETEAAIERRLAVARSEISLPTCTAIRSPTKRSTGPSTKF